ncbi:hypothetical protein diail_7720 [Diaporthe ilicicola]|nr:hypothetical protein diail_7720 [Diaporthe ilicicola]
MATSDDGNLEEAIEDFKECWSNLILLPGLGERRGRKTRELLGTEILDDPKTALTKAITLFHDFLTRCGGRCGTRIPKIVRNSLLARAGPLNIVFACLPDPDELERSYASDSDSLTIYNTAHEMLSYLVTVFGQDWLGSAFDADPLLNGLLSILYVANNPKPSESRAGRVERYKYGVWWQGLRYFAWEMRDEIDIRRYNPPTIRLLEYLRWAVQGRKDVTCKVQKPRAPVDLELLNSTAQLDLRCLFSDRFSGVCRNCYTSGARLQCISCQQAGYDHWFSGAVYCDQACLEENRIVHATFCKETRDLHRCARLFQDAFDQLLLVIQHEIPFTALMKDGLVQRVECDVPSSKSLLVGFSPYLDLSKPEVVAALNSWRCCAIQVYAQVLLDYFIRPSCHSIRYCDFVPKNAHITVNIETDFNSSPLHTVSLLTTRSGLEFAFDPTAAQFGWQENLAPWWLYRRRRVDLLVNLSRPITLVPRPSKSGKVHYRNFTWAAEEIVDIAKACLPNGRVGGGVLDFSEEDFEAQRVALKQALKVWMTHWGVQKGFL